MVADAHPLRGIALMLAAVLCFALLDATAKQLSQKFPVPMLVWARYAFHLLLMLLFLAPSLRGQLLATRRPGLQIVRAIMLVCVTGFAMAAFRLLPLAETTALLFISPLLVALLAGPFLHERVTRRHWGACLIGFGGALLIARPGGALNLAGVLFVLAAALCYSIYQIQTRQLSPTENTWAMLFYTALVGTVAMTLATPLYWSGPWPSLAEAALIASLGILGSAGHFFLISAFRHAPATTLSPLLYAQLVWATLLGWLFFGDWPDGWSLLGMLLIAGSSASLAFLRRSA